MRAVFRRIIRLIQWCDRGDRVMTAAFVDRKCVCVCEGEINKECELVFRFVDNEDMLADCR